MSVKVLRLKTAGSKPRPAVSSGRETVESFVLVFLLFLVLSLEAEGFVIPTGSMAPTLMGRHKEVTCPQCGDVYAVNADREVGSDTPAGPVAGQRIVWGTCVNCRFPTRIDDEPNFQGDRIYVIKTPLSVPFVTGDARLGRWEVAVFKLPEDPEVRYIKRLVGMPGEVLRILRGDIRVRPAGGPADAPFRRALRPLIHQDDMQMLVYDDSHRPAALDGDPRWKRWAAADSAGWVETKAGTYTISREKGQGWIDLRYRHVVPDPVQWDALIQKRPPPHPPRPTLVTDFYSYNTDLTAEAGAHPLAAMKAWRQPHWVGDLTLKTRVDVVETVGTLRFELVKAGVPNRCEIDLATGLATLSHGETTLGGPAATGLNQKGAHDLVFSNVDDRLSLRVGGRLPFGDGRSFDPGDGEGAVSPTAADLEPAAVSSEGASVEVSGLVLSRDIYYTLDPSHFDLDGVELNDPLPTDPVAMFDWLGDPRMFPAFGKLGARDFPIAPGRYMMLGDNSPWSRDGRAWQRPDQVAAGSGGWDDSGREAWEVPESLLIGKAFCVYWPHLKPFGPTFKLGQDLRLPVRPYLEKIRWIR